MSEARWLEATCGARFSNAPDNPPTVYGNQFLPWPTTVPLLAGDQIELRIEVVLSAQIYEWTWTTQVRRPGQAGPDAEFKQSTFQSHLLDAAGVRRGTPAFRPAPRAAAAEECFLLERIDGQRLQGELAAALRARFPERFPDGASALARVIRTVHKVES